MTNMLYLKASREDKNMSENLYRYLVVIFLFDILVLLILHLK